MTTAQENVLMTHVEGDAPMGQWMREHWIPCVRSAQLVAGGKPERVRLLGEDFVAFRTHEGKLGFIDEGCPHRGASMAMARNEREGLTCIFHGWRMSTNGAVLDAPSQLKDAAAYAARVPHHEYPVFEGGGLVWVWLGKSKPAERPNTPFCMLPDSNVWVTRTITPCNWLQGVEGTLDSIHVGTLHKYWITNAVANAAKKTGEKRNIGLALDSTPGYEAEITDYGLSAAALRTLQDGRTYARVTEYLAPFVSLVPATGDEIADFFISVPMDNHNHMLFFGFYHLKRPVTQEECMDYIANEEANPNLNNYANLGSTPDEHWGQDRDAMERGHFSGFTRNIIAEDVVVQASMGRIRDRTKDFLSSSDVAVATVRRMLLDILRDFQAGKVNRPPLPSKPGDYFPLDSLLDAGVDWRTRVARHRAAA